MQPEKSVTLSNSRQCWGTARKAFAGSRRFIVITSTATVPHHGDDKMSLRRITGVAQRCGIEANPEGGRALVSYQGPPLRRRNCPLNK
jgi:hypothetical protein